MKDSLNNVFVFFVIAIIIIWAVVILLKSLLIGYVLILPVFVALYFFLYST